MRFTFTVAVAIYLASLVVVVGQQPTAPALRLADARSGQATRFDMQVRADFFAGFSGDMTRFERAMARCEEVLAANPAHAEAMVWHGAGLFVRAGLAFQKGDIPNGMELWKRGLGEMDKAVSLAPDDVAVRIPRGATLLEGSRQVPDPVQSRALVKIAVGDFEHVLDLQKEYFPKLSSHAKGELLFGLADGWARLGEKAKAAEYFKRLTTDAADSGRVTYAKAWLDGTPPANPGRCVGCH